MTDARFYSLNGDFGLKNVECTLKPDFNREQRVLRAHLHGEKLSYTFHCRIIDDDLLHSSDARAVGPFTYKEGAGLAAQQERDKGEKNADKDRRNRIKRSDC